MTKAQVLSCEYLQIRAKILEIAAALDRVDRADGELPQTAERLLLNQAIETLLSDSQERAEHVQLQFSRDYNADWWHEYQL